MHEFYEEFEKELRETCAQASILYYGWHRFSKFNPSNMAQICVSPRYALLPPRRPLCYESQHRLAFSSDVYMVLDMVDSGAQPKI